MKLSCPESSQEVQYRAVGRKKKKKNNDCKANKNEDLRDVGHDQMLSLSGELSSSAPREGSHTKRDTFDVRQVHNAVYQTAEV